MQWGYVDDASNYSHTIELSFTIAFAAKPYIIDTIMAVKNASSTNFFTHYLYRLPIQRQSYIIVAMVVVAIIREVIIG